MKTTLFALGLLALTTTATLAQQRGLGLTFNEAAFGSLPTLPDPNQGAKTLAPLSLAADLSRFAPVAGNQGAIPTCVAWSTVYTAYTIQYAAQKNITDPTELRRISLSAMLPYKQLRPGCNAGLNLDDIANHVRDNGNVSFSEFNSTSCDISPTSELIKRAKQNRPITDVLKVFGPSNTVAEKIYLTKRQIDTYKAPVIVGIQATDRLSMLNASDDYYQPGGNFVGLHAVTVVGYDRVSFKILNSWGPQWSRNGYFSVRFEDFAQIAVGGVAIVLPDSYTPGPKPTTVQIGGTFAFQYLDNSGNFQKVNPAHLGNGIYELSRKDWHIGDGFQLLANNARQGQHICVFNVNPKNEVKALYPLNTKLAAVQPDNQYGVNITDVVPKSNFALVLPAENKMMAIEEAGTDYLCVIYSDKPLLDDIPDILKRIQAASGDIYSRLRAGLGNRLVPARNINYQNGTMGGSTNTSEGDVIPLILKVQSVN